MMFQKQKAFLTSAGTPIKSGQEVKEFLDALLLPSEMAVIQIEVYADRGSREVKGNTLVHHLAKQAALTKVMLLTKSPKGKSLV